VKAVLGGIGKEEIKLSLFEDDKNVHVKNLKE